MRNQRSANVSVLALLVGLGLALPASALAQASEASAPPVSTAPPGGLARAVPPINAGATQVGEVYVTARKRVERLVDAPLAVSELTQRDLSKYNTTDVTTLSQQIPSLNAQFVSTGQGGSIAIHGFGSAADPGVNQAVSLNFDGIQISQARFLRADFFDLENVEVLKGPQALFFGKNSPAGVVSLASAGPGSTFSGYATVGGSPEYGKEFVEAAVSVPINDTLSIRLAARLDHEDGFLQNYAQSGLVNPFYCNPGPGPCVHPLTRGSAQGSSVPDYTSVFGRLTVVWHPIAAFHATLKLLGGVYNDNGDVANTQNVCTTGHPMYNYIGVPVTITGADCNLDLHTSIGSWPAAMASHWIGQNKDGLPFSTFSPFLGSLNMSYDFGKITLTSVSGVIFYRAVNEGNSDQNTYTVAGGGNNEYGRQFSEELRVSSHLGGPLDFLAGIYLEHSYRKYVVNSHFLPDFLKFDCGFGQGYDCRNGRSGDYEADDPTHDDTVSPFVQGTWRITPQLTADVGVRFVYERVDASVGNVYVNQSIFAPVAAGLFSPEGVKVGGKIDATNWSPEATLTYKPIRDLTFYAAYKSGFQSGGFSNPGLLSPGLTAAALSFKPMTASGEEFGIKWETMQHTLRGDFTIYDYTFDNDQIQSAQLLFPEGPDGPQTVFYSIRNAASAVTKGAEFEVDWQTPLIGLSLNVFANYNVGKFQSYPDAPCPTGTSAGIAPCVVITPATPLSPQVAGVNLSGHPLANAPLWTLRLGLDYHHKLTQNASWAVSFDANYRSSQYLAEPASPFANIPSACEFNNKVCPLWLFDASARVYTDDGKWEFAVIGKNLANKIYPITTGSVLFGATPSQLAAGIGLPLEVLFQLTYHYR